MLGGLALSLVAAGCADAAAATYRFSISPRAYGDALIELGVQANVSLLGASACGSGGYAGLTGVFTLEAALGRLLAGAPCTFRILDPRTVRIAATAPERGAEPPQRPAPTLVAELLVTATKRPASVNRVPGSVTVIPHDQIEMTGAADVLHTMGQLSGVLTTNLGPGRDKLILRGLSDGAFTGRTRSTVGSYLDDAAINYNAPDPDLQLVDVERIEVIRGPQGALYGSGSLSGVFRIVTRKPDMTATAFGLQGVTANTHGGDPSREIEGYGNIPLVRDIAALRVVAYRDVEGGYIDNANLRLSNVDRTVREGGRVAARLQPSDAWQLDLTATSQRLRSNDTQYDPPTIGPAPRRKRVQEGHKNDFVEAAATLRGEFGWSTLRSSVAVIDHSFASQYDASAVVVDRFGAGPSDLGVYDERTRITMISQDSVLRSSRPGPWTWLAGIYSVASIEKSPSTLDVQSTGALQQVYAENRRDRLRESAVYAEASYLVTPRWTASVGGRLFTSDVQTQSVIEAKAPGGVSRSFRNKHTFQGFSPKLSIQRELDSGGVVYALFSEGYRPGGFNSGGFAYPFLPGRSTFSPDRLRNYELGVKTWFLDRRLNVRSAVFFDRWKKIQTDQYRPSGLAYTANVGDADIRGLETEVGYDFDFGLSVQASTLLSSSRITRANPDFAPQLISGLPSAPKFSGGLLAVYQRPLPLNLTLRLIGETSYVGASALSFDATKQTRMGEYVQTNLSAQLTSRAWSATLFVSNPTNNAGNTFAYGNPFTFGQVRQSTPQRPRTIGLRLAANY